MVQEKDVIFNRGGEAFKGESTSLSVMGGTLTSDQMEPEKGRTINQK